MLFWIYMICFLYTNKKAFLDERSCIIKLGIAIDYRITNRLIASNSNRLNRLFVPKYTYLHIVHVFYLIYCHNAKKRMSYENYLLFEIKLLKEQANNTQIILCSNFRYLGFIWNCLINWKFRLKLSISIFWLKYCHMYIYLFLWY